MFRIVIVVVTTLCLCAHALAQWGTPAPAAISAPDKSVPAKAATAPISIKDLEASQLAVIGVWEKMPLLVRRAVFVTEKPQIVGAWSERPSNVFKVGDPMITYVEPVGYTWKPRGDLFDFGLSADVIIKSSEGKILGGQENFAHVSFSNRIKLQEFMLNLTMSADGLVPGKYVLEYKLHDQGSDKVTTFAQPFTIVQ
jgi:hypothetical protein